MTSLLDQLQLGPQHGTQNDASTTGKETLSKRAIKNKRKKLAKIAAAEEERKALMQGNNLQPKANEQSKLTGFAPGQRLTFDAGFLPIKPATLPNPQLPQPDSSSLRLNTTQITCVGRVSPIEEDSRKIPDGTLTNVAPLQWKMHLRDFSSPRDTLAPNSSSSIGHPITHAPGANFERYPTVPNLFRFSSSHDLLASLSRESVLHKAKEKEEPKKSGKRSGKIREGDTWKARWEADLLTARPDLSNQMRSSNDGSSSSSTQRQAQPESKLPSPRQELDDRPRPFLFTSPTKSIPGDTVYPSSLGRSAFGSITRVPPSAKVEPPAVFPSLEFKGDLNAFTFQAAQTSTMSSQYRSKVDDSPSVGRRSYSPDGLPPKLQGRVKRESSASPVGQKLKKIKVEETG